MIECVSNSKVGVFVDVANITMNGGRGMRYDVLREFAVRDGGEVVRLNAYLSHDSRRADDDPDYRQGQYQFHAILRDFGYKVIQKPVRWYRDERGRSVAKANVDLEIAVDLLLQSANLDRIVLVTGDGDFVQVVRALQNRGCRVEVLAFENISSDLKAEADMFVSGYLVPNLLPARREQPWGELGSRVRAYCYHHTGKGYGFFRFIQQIGPGLWIVDTRNEDSPYASVFFHDSKLPQGVHAGMLPSRNLIFELTLVEPERAGASSFQADEIEVISGLDGGSASTSGGSDSGKGGRGGESARGDEGNEDDEDKEGNENNEGNEDDGEEWRDEDDEDWEDDEV